MGAPNATGRGSCGQRRKRRRAPLRSALTVTVPLSVTGRGGRDEGRPGKISTACGASNKGHGRNDEKRLTAAVRIDISNPRNHRLAAKA
jgi:hypothetical protein